jgi:hypothetical protein
VAVAAVIFGTIRRPLHRDEAGVQSVGFATSTAQARAPRQFSSSGRGGGVRSSGAGSSCCSCRRPRSWRLGLPRCSSHPSSRRLGHWRRPPLSSRGSRRCDSVRGLQRDMRNAPSHDSPQCTATPPSFAVTRKNLHNRAITRGGVGGGAQARDPRAARA